MGYQWSNQERLKASGVPSMNSIIEAAESISNLKVKALYCLLYLTAGRIRELVQDRTKNLPSIKKKDFSVAYRNNRKVILIDMRNEKNKNRHRKEIPITLDNEENLRLWSYIKEYLDTLNLENELFDFSYQYAYKSLKPYIDGNPHWLRHVRLTHLITIYDFNESLLSKYAGWSDSRPAKHYAELRWTDFLDRL